MKKILIILLLLPSLAWAQLDFDDAINSVSKRISFKIYEQEKSKVAVANLNDHLGKPNELGGLVAEEVTVALLKHSHGFEVMDRTHLEAIFKEHKLAMGGLMNDSTIIELGKLESVEVVIVGSIVRLGGKYKITVKAIDTETAMVIAADKEYFRAERYLDDYYGLDTGVSPDPDPIRPHPDPDPLPVVDDCEGGGYGYIEVANHTTSDIKFQIDCGFSGKEACIGRRSMELRSGYKDELKQVCMGNVAYRAIDRSTGKIVDEGTIYLKQCQRKIITLK